MGGVPEGEITMSCRRCQQQRKLRGGGSGWKVCQCGNTFIQQYNGYPPTCPKCLGKPIKPKEPKEKDDEQSSDDKERLS